MKQTEITIPAEYLSTLNINGMKGRLVNLPYKKQLKRKKAPEILLIYGHHSSLERMYSMGLSLSNYANITMPDLPGFGGMDSFYTINKKPSLENMADYLATFIKLYYKKRKFNIAGMSFGFLVVTTMLQKYPSLAKQINVVVSIVGFTHEEEFTLGNKFFNSLLYGSRLAKTAPASFVLKNVVLTKPMIKAVYNMNADGHAKLKDADSAEKARRINFEVYLWQTNDIRTYFATTATFLKVDLTKKKVDKTLYHVSVKDDQYFDQNIVHKNLNKVYTETHTYIAKLPNHAPTVISDEKEAGKIIPPELKKVLKKL